MAQDALRVLILAGGLSHERDVSIRSGRRVAEALRGVGVDVHIADVDADLLPLLRQQQPDVVWPLLHGATGEDGALRGVLDVAQVPYVGADAGASQLAWDKSVAKTLLQRAGVATPEFVALPQGLFRELGASHVLAALSKKFEAPLVVKPTRGGSALGVTIVDDAAQLPRAMVECFSYGDVALVERAVAGTEISISVVETADGLTALPAVEIVALDGNYDYDARYNPGRVRYFAPARLQADVAKRASEVALAAHRTLGLRHVSRTDLIVDAAGEPWFLEVNVTPGMTETSLLPQAARADDHDLGELYRAIVTHAASGLVTVS